MVQKQKLLLQQTLGITILSAIGSLFTKEAGSKLQALLQENLEDIDGKLRGADGPETEDDEYEEFTMRTRRRMKRPTKSKVERMAAAFHVNFARLTGARMPSLDEVIKRAQKEQALGLELARIETAEAAAEKDK